MADHEREGEGERGEPAARAQHGDRAAAGHESVSGQPARGHGQGERGEAASRDGRARAERAEEPDRRPVAHCPLGQEAAEGDESQDQDRACRSGQVSRTRFRVDADALQARHRQEGGGAEHGRAEQDVTEGRQPAVEGERGEPRAGEPAQREERVQPREDRPRARLLERHRVGVHGHVERSVERAEEHENETQRDGGGSEQGQGQAEAQTGQRHRHQHAAAHARQEDARGGHGDEGA